MSNKKTGIHNYGFNCFMNSTIQCLSTLSRFKNEIMNDSDEIDINILKQLSTYNDLENKDESNIEIDINGTKKKLNDELFNLYGVYYNIKNILYKIFNDNDSNNSNDNIVYIKSFIFACRKYEKNNYLFNGSQCDAQEFLTYLLDIFDDAKKHSIDIKIPDGKCETMIDKLNKATIEKFSQKYKDNYSWVIRDFGSMIITIIKCSECNHIVHPIDPILMSILQIPGEKSVTIYDCLDHYFGKEILSDSDKWKCEKCGNEQDNFKESRMIDFPNCLIIVIARFAYNFKSNRWTKHNQLVEAPEFINLSKYALNKESNIDDNKYSYELKAVCNHVGNVGGGHYYAHCKFNDEWYRMNDESCSTINRTNLIDNNSYMLFYEKNK